MTTEKDIFDSSHMFKELSLEVPIEGGIKASSETNLPFNNTADDNPFKKDVYHKASGLLVPDGGPLVTYGLRWNYQKRDYEWYKTTNANWMIQGIDSIEIRTVNGHSFKYTIFIMGHGVGWKTKIKFYDVNGDNPYTKKLYSHTPKMHTIDYNSDGPGIYKIEWEYD
ncbi:MAG: hypothetical protein AAF429_12635 [Pseudomonadota bacterium]